jgi:glycine oxidase
MLLFHARPGQLTRILLYKGHYAIPRADGRILVGSTMEQVGFDRAVTDDARDELVDTARSLVPFLAETPLERHWSGLRPGSPEGIPYIGVHPGGRGLFVNAGHYRNGVVMAPASARMVTDIVLNRPTILDPAPYALENRPSAA